MTHPETSHPPRILWIYKLSDAFGGSFNSILENLRYRDRRTFEVLATTPEAGSCSRALTSLGIDVFFKPIVPAGLSYSYVRSIASFAHFLRKERVSLVYFPDYGLWRPPQLVASVLSRTPVVVHLRSPLSQGLSRDRWLHRCDAIIGNSIASLKNIREHVDEHRLHVVHNFVDFERYGSGEDRRESFFGDRPQVVGFVGAFRPEKGIEYFLEMAKLIVDRDPKVRFLAVGGESSVRDVGFLPRMKSYAEQLGVANVVTFTGKRDDIPDVMKSMDVLVLPSLREGFGRVILEANAAGRPVVGADAAGIPEVIEPGITGYLVPPQDPVTMADVVMKVLRDRSWRERVAAEAPGRVAVRFAPERQVAALEEVWSQALSGRQPRSEVT